jgi:two-component system cell cycle sensor histidine kinase/response regulator CckA
VTIDRTKSASLRAAPTSRERQQVEEARTVPLNEGIRLLLVEDSSSDAKLIVHQLRRGGIVLEFERVEDAAAMRAALDRGPWDAIVSDWSMPQFSALGALDVLIETGLDLPFIIVSGTVGEEAAVEAMRAGADDYVIKDNLARLVPVLERELRESKSRAIRRDIEKALRESETRFRRLAESGIIGIVVADVRGKILDANEAYLEMVGYSREEVLAGVVRWSDLTPRDLQHLADRATEQLKESGVARPWETEVLRKDLIRVPILVGVAMLDPSKWIAFTADLTPRKRAEEALRNSESQLRQAQKMEAVGRLAGGVAHDFNNMLSVILSYGDLILADLKPGDSVRDDVEEIRKAAKRAADLTRQLLMFSRQQVLEPKVLDLNDLLASTDKMLQRILGEDVDLVLRVGASLGWVRVDPSSMDQVIMNLVVNARDAMPTGGKLTIETDNVVLDEAYARAHFGVKPGPHVTLVVKDTGVGMDEATMAHIFEPFFTTKEKGKGTGLGLSTVFGIVQQSGGTIWVQSEIGKGTAFRIFLPRVDAALETFESYGAPTTLRGTETILLVEDEDQVRNVAREILRGHGYHVIEARHPGEALLISEERLETIHLLLSDVVMPHMSGPQLAKRLAPTRPAMKVLCMSGYSDDSIFRHGVESAEMGYLQKPITPETLTRKVREVLDAPTGSFRPPAA